MLSFQALQPHSLVALPALTARARSVVNMTIAISVTGRSTGIADLHFLFLRTFQARQPLSFNSPLIGLTALPSRLQFGSPSLETTLP